jgi:hypothetical protein
MVRKVKTYRKNEIFASSLVKVVGRQLKHPAYKERYVPCVIISSTSMQSPRSVVRFAKQLITRDDFLDPVLLVEGTKDRVSRAYPDAPEQDKALLLEALGFTIAAEDQVGDLVQVFLVRERTGELTQLRTVTSPDGGIIDMAAAVSPYIDA